MNQTDSLTEVSQKIVERITQAKNDLGIVDVYYGDQNLVPRMPAICIEPTQKTREFAGALNRTENTFEVQIFLYFCILDNLENNRRDCDSLAENLEAYLHKDLQLDGLIIQGNCTSIESGYAQRNNVVIVTSRLTWRGLSKTII